MHYEQFQHDVVAAVHGPLLKSVGVVAVGVAMTVYSAAQRAMAYAAVPHVAAATMAARVAPEATDLSGMVGTGLTIAGAIWTFYLYQRSRKTVADLEDAKKRAEVELEIKRNAAEQERELKLKARLDDIHAHQAEQMAEIKVMIEMQNAHLTQQDVAIAAVKDAVRPAPATQEPDK